MKVLVVIEVLKLDLQTRRCESLTTLKKCEFLVSTCISLYSQQDFTVRYSRHLAVVFSMALCVHSSHGCEGVFWYKTAFFYKVLWILLPNGNLCTQNSR